MSFRITYTACQSATGNQPMANVLQLNPVAHIFCGDILYNDYAMPAGFNGVTISNLTFDTTGATAGSKYSDMINRFEVPYGFSGLQTYKQFWSAWGGQGNPSASNFKVYIQWDDHVTWNNNDHTLAIANNTFTPAGTTMASLANVLFQEKLCQDGKRYLEGVYSNNPPRNTNGNGDVPLALVGTAVAKDFDVEYFYKDYDADGNETTNGTGVLRVIFPDAVTYKSPAGSVTITVASPAVVTHTAHGLAANTPVTLVTNSRLPTGLSQGVTYFVKSVNANSYNLSLTSGGANINTSGTQDGSHAVIYPNKTLYGTVQLAWMKALMVEAKAAGFKHILVSSTKDLFNLDNNDGPWSYATERDALLSYIDTNDLPVIWMCGDKHYPHVGISRKANGDAYDAIAVCACPFGQGLGTLSPYKQNVWAYGRNDGTVIGSIYVDTDRGQTVLSIIDAWTMETLFSAEIPWYSRLPTTSGIKSSVTPALIPAPYQFRDDLTALFPVATTIYKNTDTRPKIITVVGGTITSIARSRDGAVFDTCAGTAGDYLLPAGDFLRIIVTNVTGLSVTSYSV